MFEDDRSRLLQISDWLVAIEEGIASSNEMADGVLGWRLGRIEQCCAGLSNTYLRRHPEIGRLGLPTLDEILGDLSHPVEHFQAIAVQAAQVFLPLLADLPSPPAKAPSQPNPASQHDRIIRDLRRLEPQLRAKGVAALYLFGSVARREDGPMSDVDLAFDIDPIRSDNFSLFDQANALNTLVDALETAVDLVVRAELRPELRSRIEDDLFQVF